MVMTWVVAIALVIVIRVVVGRPKLVPSHGQAVIESVLTGIKDIVDPIVGSKAIKAAFPLLMALFTYILIQNWSGLIPGVGTVLMRSHTDGKWMEFARPAYADMNGTIALSLCAFIAGLILVMRFAGIKVGADRYLRQQSGPERRLGFRLLSALAHLLCRRPPRAGVDRLRPSDLTLVPSLRKYLRRRNSAAFDVGDFAMGAADSLLLHGASRRPGARHSSSLC